MEGIPSSGQKVTELTPSEKNFKKMGLATINHLAKHKNLILTVVACGIITAFVLTYLVLF